MKKTIVVLTTAISLSSAFAASNTTVSTSSSTSLLDINTYKNILNDMSMSYYASASKGQVSAHMSQSEFYNEINVSYKINESVNTYARIRYGLGDDVKNEKDESIKYSNFKNPRVGVRAFQYENGNFSISPEFRLELPIAENKNNVYAISRLSQSSVYKLNDTVSFGLWTGITENISTDESGWDTQNLTGIMITPSVNYTINDAHSFTLQYETNTKLNKKNALKYLSRDNGVEAKDFYNNKLANNTIYLDYNNSSIKNLTIVPGLTLNAAKSLRAENLGAQLQISLSL